MRISIIVVISISDIRREKEVIRFSYFTNSQKNSLCKLMNKNGVTRNSMVINPDQRRGYYFSHTDPKKDYLLQCLIGDDVSIRSGTYKAASDVITIPRDKNTSFWSIVRLSFVILFVGGGILGLIILFRRPEFFDLFFAPLV